MTRRRRREGGGGKRERGDYYLDTFNQTLHTLPRRERELDLDHRLSYFSSYHKKEDGGTGALVRTILLHNAWWGVRAPLCLRERNPYK